MKKKGFWIGGIILSLIVGLFAGYALMPDKIVIQEKVVMPECPNVICEEKICEVCPEPVKCTYEKAGKQKIEEKKESLKTKIFTMKSGYPCEDYIDNKGISEFPKCVEDRKIVSVEPTEAQECIISYLAGQC